MAKERSKILAVDDHPMVIRELQKRLTAHGFDFIGAQYGDQGIEIAKEERPDLILLDVLLSEADGKEVLKKLKNDPRTENIPVIFLTVTLSKKNDKEEKTIEIDGESYLAFAKPVYYPKFLSEIRKAIKEYKKKRDPL